MARRRCVFALVCVGLKPDQAPNDYRSMRTYMLVALILFSYFTEVTKAGYLDRNMAQSFAVRIRRTRNHALSVIRRIDRDILDIASKAGHSGLQSGVEQSEVNISLEKPCWRTFRACTNCS